MSESIHEMVNRVTRIEVIDDGGRQFTRRDTKIGLSFQDGGRTLKVFVQGDEGATDPARVQSVSEKACDSAEGN